MDGGGWGDGVSFATGAVVAGGLKADRRGVGAGGSAGLTWVSVGCTASGGDTVVAVGAIEGATEVGVSVVGVCRRTCTYPPVQPVRTSATTAAAKLRFMRHR